MDLKKIVVIMVQDKLSEKDSLFLKQLYFMITKYVKKRKGL